MHGRLSSYFKGHLRTGETPSICPFLKNNGDKVPKEPVRIYEDKFYIVYIDFMTWSLLESNGECYMGTLSTDYCFCFGCLVVQVWCVAIYCSFC